MTDPAVAEPGRHPKRRRRVVLGASAAGIALVAVAVVVAVSAGGHDSGAVSAPSALAGRAAPALAGETVTGGHVSLASYRGRWVIVNFFASWCVPCQRETAELAAFAAAHTAAKDPQILGVVYQDDDISVRAFIRGHHVTWPLLGYRGIAAATAYGVAGIPVTFLIDPAGRVATKVLGGLRAGQLDTLLAAAQAQPAAPAPGTP